MRRENDKYQFKEPFGREIRKKMIESQKKAFQGPEKFLKLGQLKPNQLATVGHVATGIYLPEKKSGQTSKSDKPKSKGESRKPKKAKKPKRKKTTRDKSPELEDSKQPVEKKAKKGDDPKTTSSNKKVSDISLKDFDNIRRHLPTGILQMIIRILLREQVKIRIKTFIHYLKCL